MEEHRLPETCIGRRELDQLHASPCTHLQELDNKVLAKLEEVVASQAVILKKQEEMSEVLIAWNNTKGFIRTVVLFSSVVKWAVGTGVAVGAVWYFITRK